MQTLKDGSCTLLVDDIVNAPYACQVTLKLLQDKGAPIIGGCVLCLDARYRWFVIEDRLTQSVEYTWKSKED